MVLEERIMPNGHFRFQRNQSKKCPGEELRSQSKDGDQLQRFQLHREELQNKLHEHTSVEILENAINDEFLSDNIESQRI